MLIFKSLISNLLITFTIFHLVSLESLTKENFLKAIHNNTTVLERQIKTTIANIRHAHVHNGIIQQDGFFVHLVPIIKIKSKALYLSNTNIEELVNFLFILNKGYIKEMEFNKDKDQKRTFQLLNSKKYQNLLLEEIKSNPPTLEKVFGPFSTINLEYVLRDGKSKKSKSDSEKYKENLYHDNLINEYMGKKHFDSIGVAKEVSNEFDNVNIKFKKIDKIDDSKISLDLKEMIKTKSKGRRDFSFLWLKEEALKEGKETLKEIQSNLSRKMENKKLLQEKNLEWIDLIYLQMIYPNYFFTGDSFLKLWYENDFASLELAENDKLALFDYLLYGGNEKKKKRGGFIGFVERIQIPSKIRKLFSELLNGRRGCEGWNCQESTRKLILHIIKIKLLKRENIHSDQLLIEGREIKENSKNFLNEFKNLKNGILDEQIERLLSIKPIPIVSTIEKLETGENWKNPSFKESFSISMVKGNKNGSKKSQILPFLALFMVAFVIKSLNNQFCSMHGWNDTECPYAAKLFFKIKENVKVYEGLGEMFKQLFGTSKHLAAIIKHLVPTLAGPIETIINPLEQVFSSFEDDEGEESEQTKSDPITIKSKIINNIKWIWGKLYDTVDESSG